MKINFDYTNHALDRMEERGVSKGAVELAIINSGYFWRHYDQSYETKKVDYSSRPNDVIVDYKIGRESNEYQLVLVVITVKLRSLYSYYNRLKENSTVAMS